MTQPSAAKSTQDPHPGRLGENGHPRKALGFRDLVMFYVVATLSLRWIPFAASAGPSSLVIWLIGLTTIFIPLALCIMELSSRYPQEGGMYVWSKRAFGDFPAFMTGWIYWTSNLPYFPAVLYFAASNALYIGGTRWRAAEGSATYFVLFSLFGLGLALVLNVVGLDIGKWLSNLGAIGAWVPVGLLIVLGGLAWWKFGMATSFTPASMTPTLNMGNIAVWGTLLYAFSGAESASFMGDEIKDRAAHHPACAHRRRSGDHGGLHAGNDSHPCRVTHESGEQPGGHHAGDLQQRRASGLAWH